jgi:hypothetical protein
MEIESNTTNEKELIMNSFDEIKLRTAIIYNSLNENDKEIIHLALGIIYNLVDKEEQINGNK